MKGHPLAWILLLGLMDAVTSQGGSSANQCRGQLTCGKCMEASPQCNWCSSNVLNSTSLRCDHRDNLLSKGCPRNDIVNMMENKEFLRNENLRDEGDTEKAIQLSPQEVKLTVRAGQPLNMMVRYKQALNYPLDLYYLLDLSCSMREEKETLANIAQTLADRMKEVTRNFRLGFGSFVDKKVAPQYDAKTYECGSCSGCIPPYSFRNHIGLTSDFQEFTNRVREAKVSRNLDKPESQVEGMVQSIVCQQEIGWRNGSRRLLLLVSDAPFKIAGDTKLAYVMTPNDGKCHLDSDGYLTPDAEVNHDYPSVGLLVEKAAKHQMNLIFAVNITDKRLYTDLSNMIEGSRISILKKSGQDEEIINIIQENYRSISGSVELKVRGAEGMKVSFRTKCLGQVWRAGAKCEHVEIGREVTFDMRIEVPDCSTKSRDIQISPVGLGETLTVHVEVICQCPCERPENKEPTSRKCSSVGAFECGACTCNEGFYGDTCQCQGGHATTEQERTKCKETPTSEVCTSSERGDCICGQCVCHAILGGFPSGGTDEVHHYSGKYCQCDDYDCERFKGLLCGGPERGSCSCSECQCKQAYNGTACQCPTSVDACMATNGEICNGQGQCVCGQCRCEGSYRGFKCEDCPTCSGRCDANKECVLCHLQAAENPDEPGTCDAQCGHVDIVDELDTSEQAGAKKYEACSFADEDYCLYYFQYEIGGESITAQRTRNCPEKVNLMVVLLSVGGGILLIGIIALITCKLLVTVYDRREYVKLQTELQNVRWEQTDNPLYVDPSSKVTNPAFDQRNKRMSKRKSRLIQEILEMENVAMEMEKK